MYEKLPSVVEFFREREHLEFFRMHAVMPRTKENAMLFMYGMDRLDIAETAKTEQTMEDYLPAFE